MSTALLDSALASAEWSWLHGTYLRQIDGRPLGVAEAVANLDTLPDPAERTESFLILRGWLTDLGLDLSAPIWLDGGVQPGPESPLWAVEALRGWRTYHLVASDRAVRLFRRSTAKGTRASIRMQMSGPGSVLEPQMRAVTEGNLDGQEIAIDLSSIVRATFAPRIGGHWWRLTMHTPDHKVAVWGNGPGRRTEAAFAELLGDRLTTHWVNAHPWLLRARNTIGYLCLGFGGLGLIMGVACFVDPQPGLTRGDAGWFVVIGAAILAIGFMPDLFVARLGRHTRLAPTNR